MPVCRALWIRHLRQTGRRAVIRRVSSQVADFGGLGRSPRESLQRAFEEAFGLAFVEAQRLPDRSQRAK